MTPDFNLLITLDALLEEGSVAGAARRLGLSASAMSRALARLRETTGDPLLVRAGRGLIPTPRAQILRDEVARLVQETRAVLRPQQEVDPASLERTFRLRSSDGFVEAVGPALLARLAVEAPGVRLHFLAKPDRRAAPCAVASWTSRPGSSAPPRPPSCAPRPCSRTTSSPWCTRTTPSATAP
nr:LysR family transcriptional regulator [Aeromonas caviae]